MGQDQFEFIESVTCLLLPSPWWKGAGGRSTRSRFASPIPSWNGAIAIIGLVSDLMPSRVATIVGATIWLLFTLLNSFTIRDPSQPLLYVRIAGIAGLLMVFAATFAIKPGRWIEPTGFMMLAANSGTLTLVLVFMSPMSLSYYPPTEIYLVLAVVSFVLAGVSFVEGVALAAGTICLFFFSVIFLWPEPGLLVVYHFAWVSAVIVLAGASSYVLDRTQHMAWLQEMDSSAPRARFEPCCTMFCRRR